MNALRHPPDSHAPPLSPFLTIFSWPVTMATSIAHRVSGVALAGGAILIAWWLLAIETGPENYAIFCDLAATIAGQIVIWLCVWCYSYHLLNGIRHLFWDYGLGFELQTANLSGIAVLLGSAAITFALMYCVLSGHGGYFYEI